VANVKTKLVTLEVQKDTFFVVVKLQYVNLQDYKVNLKDAMGCPRNSNEEIGKIRDSALTFFLSHFEWGGNWQHCSNCRR
jgi:predicted transport protein